MPVQADVGYNKAYMEMFTLVVAVVVFGLLAAVSGIVPAHSGLSPFERKRKSEQGDKEAAAAEKREMLLVYIVSLQRAVVALLLVTLVSLLVARFGWLIGIILAVFAALEYGVVGRFAPIRNKAQKLYERHEKSLLAFVNKHQGIFRFLRNATPETEVERRLASKEELTHLIVTSGTVLSADDKKLLTHGLDFRDRLVSEVMTPRGMIDHINKKELLGPLILDDLHKTGHSRFPVINEDVDHIVGVLYIQDLLVVDSGKRSTTVEKAMSPRVFYIREDQTLGHALAAFLRTHHHLFIVINEFRETVGLLSLEDVMEALLGRKIIDEFDTHEDLRVVAARNPRGNNHPEKREDV